MCLTASKMSYFHLFTFFELHWTKRTTVFVCRKPSVTLRLSGYNNTGVKISMGGHFTNSAFLYDKKGIKRLEYFSKSLCFLCDCCHRVNVIPPIYSSIHPSSIIFLTNKIFLQIAFCFQVLCLLNKEAHCILWKTVGF